MWNLLLSLRGGLDSQEPPSARGAPSPTAAAPQPFIFVEQIMGMADSIENMLHETLPFDPALHATLGHLIGLKVEALPAALSVDAREKVVHARWVRSSPCASAAAAKKAQQAMRRTLMRSIANVVPAPQLKACGVLL